MEISIPYEYIDYVIYNYNHNAIPMETLEKVLISLDKRLHELVKITVSASFFIVNPKSASSPRGYLVEGELMQRNRKKEIRVKADSFREKCKISRYGILDLFKECERCGYKLLSGRFHEPM